MDCAAPDFRLRISSGDGFRKAVQSIGRYQQNVGNATVFQAVQHAQLFYFERSAALIHRPEMSFCPFMSVPMAI